jgi:hypothetical protein
MPQIDIHLFINHIISLYIVFFFLYWNLRSNNFFQIVLVTKTRKLLKGFLINKRIAVSKEAFFLKVLFVNLLQQTKKK